MSVGLELAPVYGVTENGQPPQDELAERAVLGAMMLSRNAIGDVIGLIERDDFYKPAHQNVFEAIIHLHSQGVDVDSLLVGTELERRKQLRQAGGHPYLITLTQVVPHSSSASFYARIVAEKAMLRRLVEAGTRIAQYGYAGAEGADVAELLDRARNDIQALADSSSRLAGAKNQDPAVLDGATFILDQPTDIPARWGSGTQVLWPEGEALMIAGPQGLCKTTLAGLLVRAQLGIGDGTVIGLPVAPLDSNILYLAMDRPRQIAKSLARQFTGADRQVLKDRLVIRKGPPPADLAAQPTLLTALADEYDAGAVYVDSLKDAALGLSKDEVAAAYNRARQHLLADGRELCELHHVRKQGADTKGIEEIFGSTWLTSGCGSVILLSGEPGDPIIGFRHAKQPAEEVGPWHLLHDQTVGQLTLESETDLIDLVRAKGVDGLTARDAAAALFDTDKPTKNQKEKARRKLVALEGDDLPLKSVTHGTATAWFLVERRGTGGTKSGKSPGREGYGHLLDPTGVRGGYGGYGPP